MYKKYNIFQHILGNIISCSIYVARINVITFIWFNIYLCRKHMNLSLKYAKVSFIPRRIAYKYKFSLKLNYNYTNNTIKYRWISNYKISIKSIIGFLSEPFKTKNKYAKSGKCFQIKRKLVSTILKNWNIAFHKINCFDASIFCWHFLFWFGNWQIHSISKETKINLSYSHTVENMKN